MNGIFPSLFLAAIVFGNSARGQSMQEKSVIPCEDCEIEDLCNHFLRQYRIDNNQTKIKAIRDNWSDFFATDLDGLFPAPTGVKAMSIKFDGMGCVYPVDNSSLFEIKNEFLDPAVNFRKFHQSTFYTVFNTAQIKGKSSPPNVTHFIQSTLPDVPFQNDRFGNIPYFDFVQSWNNQFINKNVELINSKIKTNGIKKVIFYIHGFNVPYALAHLQGNMLMDSVITMDRTLKPENILFIRIFWPSGDFKHKNLNATNCDYDNIENLKTVRSFTYFSNRTYMAAIYLRRIISGMSNPEIPIEMITHSHGATLATTTVINTLHKLQGLTANGYVKQTISDQIAALMTTEPFPARKIDLFLNAPSIPGVNTFSDFGTHPEQGSYRFFIGYNNNDKVLRKQKLKIFGVNIPFIRPTFYLSSTSLGCNKKNEVYKTQKVFVQKGMEDNCSSGVNSFQDQHDFFCYLLQVEFRRNLKLFLQGGYP